MWKNKLLRLRSRFQYWLLNNTYTFNKEEISQQTLKQSLLLEPRLFKVMDISKACLYLIDIDFTNYHHCFKTLVAINTCLSTKKQIDLHLLQLTRTPVSIEHFFMSDRKAYLEADFCVQQYKDLSKTFFELYEEIKLAPTGIDGYNKRMLTQFIQALSKLTEQLRNFQHGQ